MKRRVLLAMIVISTQSGCGDPRMEWKEEVRLQTGEVIVVARSAKFRENWIAGGGGGSINEGMTLDMPTSPDRTPIKRWEDRFVPILLDQDPMTHEWFIVATFFHCDSWYELGRPKLPYTEYRYREGHWLQLGLSPSLVGRAANLYPVDLADRGVVADSKPYLTVGKKSALFESPTMGAEYKRVAGNWKSGC